MSILQKVAAQEWGAEKRASVGRAQLATKSTPACAQAAASKTGVTDLGKPRPRTRGTGIVSGPVTPLMPKKEVGVSCVTPSSSFPPPQRAALQALRVLNARVTQRDCSDHAELPAITYVSKFLFRA